MFIDFVRKFLGLSKEHKKAQRTKQSLHCLYNKKKSYKNGGFNLKIWSWPPICNQNGGFSKFQKAINNNKTLKWNTK